MSEENEGECKDREPWLLGASDAIVRLAFHNSIIERR